MKFQPRRFVVEVKRGTNREAFASPDKGSDKFMGAEALLFGGASRPAIAMPGPDRSEPSRAVGRILPSLVEPTPEPIAEPEPQRRRGRPPGSRNKPKPGETARTLPAGPGPSVLSQEEEPSRDVAVREAADTSAQAPAVDRRPSDALSEPRIRLRDRSRILQRYVHDSMPRPGQRGSLRARRAERASS